ncbi:SRPBCC family protein [Allonocardiopsis opalescens]|uniref:Polyketide cyclase/dehydrase/lipid transport protein n=1 Tax=Allonocardiopsis opalescens TaxID=1144618 RepID=A0A2T0QCJ5_9ACTN|nr:SRPBCC family protein [Allonocardiopsis opalescens]PRY01639.1 polyketide cyclase/dehydrase/lipid transport protein [Allonocardiopsis opalescens]
MAKRKVSRSIVVAAPPKVVFDILADPRAHPEFDGSGSVRGLVSGPDRLEHGSRFGMEMRLGLPYRMTNSVVEFEEGRLIAWKHLGPHIWRWELEPIAGGRTRVIETFDYSPAGFGAFLYQLLGYPVRNAQGIEATLPRLRQLAESRV